MKKYSYYIFGSLAFLYVLLRALLMGVTYDEASTIGVFVPLEIINILNFTPCDANNHILNTLLIKLMYLVFPDSLFAARLPNLIAFGFYLYYARAIARNFFSPRIGIYFFIAAVFNPFLLDFFCLARGYGLAVCFMLISIYYVLVYLQSYQLKIGIRSMGIASLAVLCNLPLINYWLGAGFVLIVTHFFNQKGWKTLFQLLFCQLILAAALVGILYEPVRKMIANNNLYYGGLDDFYTDTLGSLYTFSIGDPYGAIAASLVPLHGIMLLCYTIFVISAINQFEWKDLIQKTKFLIAPLLLIPIASNITQFYLLDTRYLIDRTGLFYYPLLVFVIWIWADEVTEDKSKRITTRIVQFLTFIFLINFVWNMNLFKTMTWEQGAHTREILDYLNETGHKDNTIIYLDLAWPTQASVNYYLLKEEYPSVKSVRLEKELNSTDAHYYLYFDKSLPKVGYDHTKQYIHNEPKDTILSYPNEGVYLFKLYPQ
jgi:hypothetical protein